MVFTYFAIGKVEDCNPIGCIICGSGIACRTVLYETVGFQGSALC